MVCHVSLGEGVFQGVSQDCSFMKVFKGDPRILLSFICTPGLLFLRKLQMVFGEGSHRRLSFLAKFRGHFLVSLHRGYCIMGLLECVLLL